MGFPADGAYLLPGVWDPWSALLAAEAGFEFAFVSGFAVAGTALGRPDVGVLTQTEVADVTRRIALALADAGSSMGLIVDADTGYGNAVNVARTVALWEQAGASGIFLEDQVWPKRCGHMAGKEVVDVDEWLTKLRAALQHRSGLHVTARTDARQVHGLHEALERGRMARDLGVDAVFVEAPESVEELERIAAALPDVTLVANLVEHGRTPLLSLAELSDLGFRIALSPLSGLLTATSALREMFGTLHEEGTSRGRLDRLASFDEFTDLVGLPQVRAIERDAKHPPGSDSMVSDGKIGTR